jgi:FtsZ-binding cell division protein ZapB
MAFVSASIDGHCQAIDISYNGQEGTWFPLDLSRKVLADVEELRLVRPKVQLLSDSLQLKVDVIENLRIAIEASKDSEKRMEEQIRLLYEDRQRLEDEVDKVRKQKNPVWKHPAVWFSVGVVVTIGVIVGAVQVIDISD